MDSIILTTILVFNLRGNQRTSGELSRKEGGKIFGSGSRTPIAITILVKKPNSSTGTASIFYHDIGDYLSREEKLKTIKEFGSICNPEMQLSLIIPNNDNDWLNQRDGIFSEYLPMESEKKFFSSSHSFFTINSNGFKTNRDAWIYNSSETELIEKVSSTINFYNSQRIQYHSDDSFQENTDSTKISWTVNLRKDMANNKNIVFSRDSFRDAMYRPFFKQKVYTERSLIERPGQILDFFPTPQSENLVICCSGVGVTKEFSCIITNIIPDLELIGKSQCFPLYYYEKQDKQRQGEFDFGDGQKNKDDYIRRDGISDFILKRCRELNPKISKEDIFYYVYGLLHSPDYCQRFSADLKKSLPHIPLPEEYAKFKAFQNIGRTLAEIHLNYETYPMCQDVLVRGENSRNYHVEKMRFISKEDKRTIVFNDCIQLENVPLKAYEYVLNGKSAIEWVMERYAITTDKASGIINDPNQWSENPRYILELLLRIIQVSVDTVDLVAQLPKWEF